MDCFEALLLCGHVVGMPDLFLFCQIQFQGSCFSGTWRWHQGWGAIARKGKMQNTLEAELGKNRSDLKTQDHLVLDYITITSQQKGGTIARKEKMQNACWGKTFPATRQGFKPPALWIWMVFICNQGKLFYQNRKIQRAWAQNIFEMGSMFMWATDCEILGSKSGQGLTNQRAEDTNSNWFCQGWGSTLYPCRANQISRQWCQQHWISNILRLKKLEDGNAGYKVH